MAKKLLGEELQFKHFVAELYRKLIKPGDSVQTEFSVQLGPNGEMGSYKTGDVVSVDTTWEDVAKKLLQKVVHPTYTKPTLTLTVIEDGTPFGEYEYGTVIKPHLRANYTMNDGPDYVNELLIYKSVEDAKEYLVGDLMNLDYTYLDLDGNEFNLGMRINYRAETTYIAGPIKKNNLGEDDDTGSIKSGTLSVKHSYTPVRLGCFYGYTDNLNEITSDTIRGLSFNTGKKYTAEELPLVKAEDFTGPKRFIVACPATETGISKVLMPSMMNLDITTEFVKQADKVVVAGANGFEGVEYNIWIYQPAKIGSDETYKITLGA